MPSIFLCRANVTVTAFRSDIMSTTDEIRMVQAETEEEASAKFEAFFTSQSTEYYDTYSVGYVNVSALIV